MHPRPNATNSYLEHGCNGWTRKDTDPEHTSARHQRPVAPRSARRESVGRLCNQSWSPGPHALEVRRADCCSRTAAWKECLNWAAVLPKWCHWGGPKIVVHPVGPHTETEVPLFVRPSVRPWPSVPETRHPVRVISRRACPSGLPRHAAEKSAHERYTDSTDGHGRTRIRNTHQPDINDRLRRAPRVGSLVIPHTNAEHAGVALVCGVTKLPARRPQAGAQPGVRGPLLQPVLITRPLRSVSICARPCDPVSNPEDIVSGVTAGIKLAAAGGTQSSGSL